MKVHLIKWVPKYISTNILYLIGILKIPPQNQQLYNKDNAIMEDSHMLQDYGLTSATAKAQSPATVGLTLRWIFDKYCGFVVIFWFSVVKIRYSYDIFL